MTVRIIGSLIIATALVAPSAYGQHAPTPTGPVTVTTLPHPQLDELAPEETCSHTGVPLLPACAPYEDCNGPLLVGDPLLDSPDWPTPGWFFDLEFGVLKPHLKNEVKGDVTLAGFPSFTVGLPAAPLAWTGSPRFEVGYRLPQAFGEFILSYRFLVSQSCGCGKVVGPFSVASRLDLHSADLDYAKRERGLGPDWDMKWRIGVRLASIYFESLAESFFEEQRTTNHFFGAGPHSSLELWRSLNWGGFSLFGRVEGTVLLGRIHQSFLDDVVAPGIAVAGLSYENVTGAVPVLQLEAGLAWVPWHKLPVRITAGYGYEVWWFVGQTDRSEADLYAQGVFLRGEWKY